MIIFAGRATERMYASLASAEGKFPVQRRPCHM
jgi:hypothetical protein